MPKPLHPRAAPFVWQGLFKGATTFEELEARIAALPDEQQRGNAFEVFAEAYLATQRKHDAVTVWPLSSVPNQVLQSLALGPSDYGIDGVFQTVLGQPNTPGNQPKENPAAANPTAAGQPTHFAQG